MTNQTLDRRRCYFSPDTLKYLDQRAKREKTSVSLLLDKMARNEMSKERTLQDITINK